MDHIFGIDLGDIDGLLSGKGFTLCDVKGDKYTVTTDKVICLTSEGYTSYILVADVERIVAIISETIYRRYGESTGNYTTGMGIFSRSGL